MDRKNLLDNLDRLHTTELGEVRIRKNVNINNEDVVSYLKDKIMDKDSLIYKNGKNYYCEIDGIRITVNSYNFCIITAHQLKNK